MKPLDLMKHDNLVVTLLGVWLLTLLFAVPLTIMKKRSVSLVANGQLTDASIINAVMIIADVDDYQAIPGYSVTYLFTDSAGVPHEGSAFSPTATGTISVLFDPSSGDHLPELVAQGQVQTVRALWIGSAMILGVVAWRILRVYDQAKQLRAVK